MCFVETSLKNKINKLLTLKFDLLEQADRFFPIEPFGKCQKNRSF